MSYDMIALVMFLGMMGMLLTGQRVFGAIGFVAAVAAYRAIVADYPDGPLVGTAIQKIKSIGLEYATIDA